MTFELRDTIDLMNSPDYRQRFQAEYWQTKIRYEKLKAILIRWEAFNENEANIGYPGSYYTDRLKEALGFIPTCPYSMLKEQQIHMDEYLHSLELSAALEHISLSESCLYTESLHEAEEK